MHDYKTILSVRDWKMLYVWCNLKNVQINDILMQVFLFRELARSEEMYVSYETSSLIG